MQTPKQIKKINSTNYWFKTVEFLGTNWALIEELENGKAKVSFIDDASGAFDEMIFLTLEQAVNELMDNGFDIYSQATEVHEFLKPPSPPFFQGTHPNGPIYSSGRFWSKFN